MVPQTGPTGYGIYLDDDTNEKDPLFSLFDGDSSGELDSLTPATRTDRLGSLRCVYHRCRPEHVSGEPDKLPFRDAIAVQNIFTSLDLPSTYLQVAEGSLSLVQSMVSYDRYGNVAKYEFIAHCLTKQGNWAMALSHRRSTRNTSVFWSVDHRMNSNHLLNNLQQFQEFGFHPLLVPCIMFAETLRISMERRLSIKEKLRVLENEIHSVNRQASVGHSGDLSSSIGSFVHPQSLERIFELLNSCRAEQASREGRYELWRSYHQAITEGLEYSEKAFADLQQEKFLAAHLELKQWTTLLWRKFESLKARDMDHVERINNISDIVCTETLHCFRLIIIIVVTNKKCVSYITLFTCEIVVFSWISQELRSATVRT